MNLAHKKLLSEVARETNLPKNVVKPVMVTILDIMRDNLINGTPVVLPGIGTIGFAYRRKRTAKTLPDHPPFKQPETYYLKLKNSQSLKDALRELCTERGGKDGLPRLRKPTGRKPGPGITGTGS